MTETDKHPLTAGDSCTDGAGPLPFSTWFLPKKAPAIPDADLTLDLRSALEGAGKVIVIGIGNEIHLADTLGLYVTWGIRERMAHGADVDPSGRLMFVMGHAVPENFTGYVREWGASHAIFVDAAAFEPGTPAGTGAVIPRDDVAGAAIATHGMPITLVCEFLEKSVNSTPIILGVQAPDMFARELDEDTLERMRVVVESAVSVLSSLPEPHGGDAK